MSPERLSGLDAAFLDAETPSLHMHVALVAVLDPATVPGGYSFRRIRQIVDERIALAPVFGRRLVEVPFRLGRPLWVDDPEFDIDNHLRRAALPSPGGMRELAEFAGDVISRQLHRDRPLWEMWIVEGIEDDKVAVVAKIHHSTIDAVSGAELLGVLLDLQPEAADRTPLGPRHLDARVPSPFELLSQAALANLTAPCDVGHTAARTARQLLDVARIRRRGPATGAPP